MSRTGRWGTIPSALRSDGTNPTPLFAAALRALADREVAFVHLVRTAADGRPIGHRAYPPRAAAAFRTAFPCALIVSGAFKRARAIELVESRWADAIGVEAGTVGDAIAPGQ